MFLACALACLALTVMWQTSASVACCAKVNYTRCNYMSLQLCKSAVLKKPGAFCAVILGNGIVSGVQFTENDQRSMIPCEKHQVSSAALAPPLAHALLSIQLSTSRLKDEGSSYPLSVGLHAPDLEHHLDLCKRRSFPKLLKHTCSSFSLLLTLHS